MGSSIERCLCSMLLLPFAVIIISVLTLLSHNILSNIIFIIISILALATTSQSSNDFHLFVYINFIYISKNILHIIILCKFRYPFSIVRILYNICTSAGVITLSIYFKTSYYLIALSLVTIISEVWIKSSKRSIEDCENNLLRLLYYDNYHKSYERDSYKDIDDNIILERKFHKGISYFHIHFKTDLTQKRDTVVMIHGYYSGKIFAASTIRTLSRYYDLIIPDLPGNGLSDRLSWFSWILSCKLYNKSRVQMEQYFVDILDTFFDDIELDTFYIVAHSFGAYLACLYAIHHPDKIKNKLILLSPVAIANVDKPSNFDTYVKSNTSMLGYYMRYCWGRYGSMQEVARCLGPCCSLRFVRWRLSAVQHSYYWKDVDEEYKEEIYRYWETYTYNMYLSVPTSLFERIFYDFIGPYLYSNEDISPRFIESISKHGINTLICHGDTDWVSKSGANHIYNQVKTMSQNEIDVKIIQKCSHQILMNQSVNISNLIRNFIEGNA